MINTKKFAKNTAFAKLANPVFLIMFIFLCFYTITIIFPILWGVMTTFKEATDFRRNSKFALPNLEFWEKNKGLIEDYDNIFGNYTKILSSFEYTWSASWMKGFVNQQSMYYEVPHKFWDYVFNSIMYAGVGSVLRAIGPVVVGYLCAKYKFKFSSIVYGYVIFVMVTPIVGASTATLNLVKQLGVHDTWFGLFMRYFGFGGMHFLVFYSFFESMPNTYAEAAEIDGASQFRVMATIYIPLAKTMISTIILLNFVGAWNDYSTALLYMPTHITLSTAIQSINSGDMGANVKGGTPMKLCAVMFLAIPIIVLFVSTKGKLMGNLSMGGLKE